LISYTGRRPHPPHVLGIAARYGVPTAQTVKEASKVNATVCSSDCSGIFEEVFLAFILPFQLQISPISFLFLSHLSQRQAENSILTLFNPKHSFSTFIHQKPSTHFKHDDVFNNLFNRFSPTSAGLYSVGTVQQSLVLRRCHCYWNDGHDKPSRANCTYKYQPDVLCKTVESQLYRC